MARFSTLLALVMAAAAVSASPVVVRDSPISLPIARRFKETGPGAILAADKARAQVLKNVAHAKGSNASKRADVLVSNANTYYSVQVGVGSPATTYTLLVDTGSSNTFVGAGQQYVQTSTSQDTGNTVVSAGFPCLRRRSVLMARRLRLGYSLCRTGLASSPASSTRTP